MPVISRTTENLNGVPWKKVVKVDSGGTFEINVPEAVTKAFGTTTVSGSTFEAAQRALNELIERFKAANTRVRRVIIHSVKAKAHIFEPDRSALHGERFVFRTDEISFTDGIALSIEVGVYDETTVEANGHTSISYEYVKSKLPVQVAQRYVVQHHREPRAVIEWTQEREDFFVRVVRAMEWLVLEMQKLKDPESLQLIIERGQFLLPAASSVSSAGQA